MNHSEQIAWDALAAAHALENVYVDARGEHHEMAPATQRALLAAMGIHVQSPESFARRLAEAQMQDWRRALPPTHVIHRGRSPFCVPIVLPQGTAQIEWRIQLEEGKEILGVADFASLPLLERRRSGDGSLERRSLAVTAPLPDGYHLLSLAPHAEVCHFIVSPGRCWLPASREDGRRLWGVAVQLSLLRSRRNWGVGDFSDLGVLAEHAAANGVDVLGVNPLHAGFADLPEQASPYSPSSRFLLNVIYIDVTAVSGLGNCPAAQDLIDSAEFQRQLTACREAPRVTYAAVMQLKRSVLRLLHDRARENRNAPDWCDFQSFVAAQEEALTRACLFQTLREHFRGFGARHADWHTWPSDFQDPESLAVECFALQNAEEVQFHLWLQWLAETQLAKVEAAARAMNIGIYRDLAVGADPAGAESWGNQPAMFSQLRVGAPPDPCYPSGQNWGITPLNGAVLREEGYRSFAALLGANMRHAGALRLDHVMCLQRLWCMPAHSPATQGGYLSYNLTDLLGVVALESHRRHCVVVGEDLGTVSRGFRERLREAQILSYRVLHFERIDSGAFLPAQDYPALAVAVAGNHDLPALRGWLLGRDLELRANIGVVPLTVEARRARAREVALLRQALVEAGIIALQADLARAEDHGVLIEAVHRFLGRTPCMLAMIQLDDWAAEIDPVNLPGTTDEYPNWRRKLSLTLEELLASPNWQTLRAGS